MNVNQIQTRTLIRLLSLAGWIACLVLGLWGAGYFKDPDAALRQAVQWANACELIRK